MKDLIQIMRSHQGKKYKISNNLEELDQNKNRMGLETRIENGFRTDNQSFESLSIKINEESI